MASANDMGIEGIDGIESVAGARGTPGFDGYPGVVLGIGVSKYNTQEKSPRRQLTDLQDGC